MMNGVLLLLIFTGYALFAQACDEAGVTQCRTDFIKFVTSDENSAFYTGQRLTDLCANVEALSNCAETVIDGCAQAVVDDYQFLKDPFDYICSDTGKEILTANAACVTSTTLETEAESCTNISQSGNFGSDYDKICNALKESAVCMLNVLESECGEEFARWYAGYLDLANASTKRIASCEFTAADLVSMATSRTFSIVILVATVVIGSVLA